MIYYFPESIESDVAFSYFFVAVLVTAERIFAIVYMNSLEAVKTDNSVEFIFFVGYS